MSKENKVLNHPSATLIIRKLKEGWGVRKVAKMLIEMYPDDKKKHITCVTLQTFRKQHLNIEGDALNEIKKAAKEKKIIREDLNAERKEARDIQNTIKSDHTRLKKMPIYQEKLEEAINVHIDIKHQLATMHSLIMSRTEELFDKLSTGEGSVSDEQNLQKYFQTYILVLEKWAKYIDKVADYTVETNVNVTVIENQMALLREAVWETIKDMDPGLAVRFLEKLDNKMKGLNYRQDKTSFQQFNNDVNILTAKIEEPK